MQAVLFLPQLPMSCIDREAHEGFPELFEEVP